ncbi:hypothetical protein TNIN_273991 [Trichonephila inaurata madagascariensis]|uniref:Uncharacterized protein n=1 Tax=Trichonephila inaurata madagascariensis TaxID=2747483 RepID=A0A8X7BZP8_9ARAC|nr:hypothetical protein TNIN_273991 [Trichonephila inaurata madagascariensis]
MNSRYSCTNSPGLNLVPSKSSHHSLGSCAMQSAFKDKKIPDFLKKFVNLQDLYMQTNCKKKVLSCDYSKSITPPIDSFYRVEFREELLTSTPKHSSHPELLRQLALEVKNDASDQALIYTDGSRSDTGRGGSVVYLITLS